MVIFFFSLSFTLYFYLPVFYFLQKSIYFSISDARAASTANDIGPDVVGPVLCISAYNLGSFSSTDVELYKK